MLTSLLPNHFKVSPLAWLILNGLYSLNVRNFDSPWLKAVQSLRSLLPSNLCLPSPKVWLILVLKNATEKHQRFAADYH